MMQNNYVNLTLLNPPYIHSSTLGSDLLIAVIGMIVVSVVLIGIPIVLMLWKPIKLRRKAEVPS
jgi:hypothetical protein